MGICACIKVPHGYNVALFHPFMYVRGKKVRFVVFSSPRIYRFYNAQTTRLFIFQIIDTLSQNAN